MKLVKAVVVKRDTEDGTSFFVDEVPIGFEYLADLDSIRIFHWYNTETKKDTYRKTIIIYGSATHRGAEIGPCPMELLRIET